MLEQMVKAIIDKVIANDRPHLKLPAVVFARVDTAKKLSETYEVRELVIHNDDSGTSFRGRITAPWYEYRLAVLDRFGNADEAFPPLPGIKSKTQFQSGAVVAVSLPYGDLTPAIIGEVKL